MKAKLLIIVFLLGSFVGMSQKLIDAKKVPENIKKVFKRKASRAENVKWFQEGKDYLAKYEIKKQACETHISRTGTITMMKNTVDVKKLPSSILKDLSANHRGKKIKEAFMIIKGRKDKYYSVILHERQGRKKPPLVYEVQYTLQGKFITIYEPEIKDEIVEDEGPTRFDEAVDEDIDDLKQKVKSEKVKRKDLPTKIEEYLKANYDYEYKAKEIYIESNRKYGEHYYIVMKKQGEKKEFQHWFDTKGNLLKKKVVEL